MLYKLPGPRGYGSYPGASTTNCRLLRTSESILGLGLFLFTIDFPKSTDRKSCVTFYVNNTEIEVMSRTPNNVPLTDYKISFTILKICVWNRKWRSMVQNLNFLLFINKWKWNQSLKNNIIIYLKIIRRNDPNEKIIETMMSNLLEKKKKKI